MNLLTTKIDRNGQVVAYQTSEEICVPGKLTCADELKDFAKANDFGSLADAHIFMACVNSQLEVIGIFEVAHGTYSENAVSPREFMQKALMLPTKAVFVFQTRPSGNTEFGELDIEFISKLKKAARIMSLPLNDYVIVTKDNCEAASETDWFRGV